jgi:hypothetical protein
MSTGCIGNFGLSGKVRKFNLETTQDRWGREILFVVLYVIAGEQSSPAREPASDSLSTSAFTWIEPE